MSYKAERTKLFLGVAFLALASPAIAQTEPEDAEARQTTVVVTGSRIATDGATTAASPVLSIGADEIETSGESDIAFLLRETPSLQGSLPGSFSAFNAADTEDSDLGLGLLNLRSLGIERTLVLQNGRRHVAGTSGQSAVDTNTIPVSLLERVEVLTGGASSIYGADAVSGVVNFVLRDGSSFEGLEYRAQGGISSEGDAEDFFASVATGFDFANGKGDAVFSLEYASSEPVFSDARSFAGEGLYSLLENSPAFASAFGRNPNASNVFVPNFTIPVSSAAGVIAIGDGGASAFGGVLDLIDFGPSTLGAAQVPTVQIFRDGTLRPYNPGLVSNGFEASGGDGISATPNVELILPESQRILFNANTSYEIVPNHNFFLETKFAFTDTLDSIQVNGFNDDIPISLDNPYIPAALRAQLDALIAEGLDPVLAVSRDVIDEDVVPKPRAERETFRIVGGFEGELPYGVAYELSYNFGRTDVIITNGNTRIEDRYFAAIDAVRDPDTNEIVCRSTLQDRLNQPITNPPLSPFPQFREGFFTFQPGDGRCQPINIFGDNSITGPGADFAFIDTIDRTVLKQESLLATFSGDTSRFFNLPGGAIGWAVGAEYRKERSEFTPDPLDTAGLTSSFRTPVSPSSGEVTVSEGFAEAKLPLLADLPFAKLVELSGSFRYSDYNSIGGTETWAVGGRYQPHDWITFRGTVSEAIRAPNIGELFSPQQPATLGATDDPCNANFINAGTEFRAANCLQFVAPGYNSGDFNSAFVPGVSGGNPALDPETAETLTAGFVFQPAGPLEGLRIIADYYDIEIEGAIDSLTGFQIASNCVDLPTINNQFCAAVDRDPTNGNITFFRSGQINLGSIATSGVDWSVSYEFDLSDVLGSAPGTVRLGAVGTKFISYDEVADPTAPDEVEDLIGEFGIPEWITNVSADWTLGQFGVGWRGRYESSQLLPGITNSDVASDPAFADPLNTDSAFVHDFSFDYNPSETLGFYAGINNAFNEEPFLATLSRPAGPRGRFFFVGVQGRF